MIRTLLLALVVFVAIGMLNAQFADAAPRISPNNPYRSFNISGINYGSVRWEQSHGRRGHSFTTHRGLRFRRW